MITVIVSDLPWRPLEHPDDFGCSQSRRRRHREATTEPRVGAFANSLSLLPLQSGSESELQAQLDWLSESNQVAVVVSQHGLPKLGFFSEDENAWGHAEVAMWGDLRVQFVTTLSSVTHMLSRARRSSRTRRAASPRRLCEVSFTGMAVLRISQGNGTVLGTPRLVALLRNMSRASLSDRLSVRYLEIKSLIMIGNRLNAFQCPSLPFPGVRARHVYMISIMAIGVMAEQV